MLILSFRKFRDRNKLIGPIPETLFKLTSLMSLDLDNNMLSGTISDSFDKLSALQFLTIGKNNFNKQPVPAALANLSNLGTSLM